METECIYASVFCIIIFKYLFIQLMLSNIKNLLKEKKAQTVLYLCGIPMWVFILWSDDRGTRSEYTLTFENVLLFGIPISILAFQTLFKSRILWWIIFGLVLMYTAFLMVFLPFFYILNPTSLFEISTAIFVVSVFISMAWVIYHMKPNSINSLATHNS